MKEELLKDPTVYHWRFFLRWHSREPKSHRQTHWETFKKALIDAIQWADLQQESVIPRYDTLPPAHQTNVRLASLPWALHPDGFTHSLESRVMLELFYLQSGCAQEGATGATAFSTLKEADWHWDDKSNSYLGDAVCLSVELTERIEKEDAREMTSSILTHWFGEPVHRVELVELSCGFLAKSVEVEDEVWVLLVWDEEQVQEQATHLVHRLMPPLVSARLKGRAIMQQFEDDVLDQTHKKEAELDGELRRVATQGRRLKLVDQASDTIAQLQMAFAAQLNECEEML